MNYSQFEEEFKTHYSKKTNNIYYTFFEEWSRKKCRFPLELVEEDIEPQYNSFGDEESYLYRVFHHTEGDFYIRFEGIRNSYLGEEWNKMYEVKPSIKIQHYFEEVKK